MTTPTYSISMRIRRVVTEYCYVSVPVTSDLIVEQADGTGRLDVELINAKAVELSAEENVQWIAEGVDVHPHPIQRAPDSDE